jgi:hypothetical protein
VISGRWPEPGNGLTAAVHALPVEIARERARAPTAGRSPRPIYFYAIAAFLVGFSERFTGVMFGGAERLLSGGQQDNEPPVTAPQARPTTR